MVSLGILPVYFVPYFSPFFNIHKQNYLHKQHNQLAIKSEMSRCPE